MYAILSVSANLNYGQAGYKTGRPSFVLYTAYIENRVGGATLMAEFEGKIMHRNSILYKYEIIILENFKILRFIPVFQ